MQYIFNSRVTWLTNISEFIGLRDFGSVAMIYVYGHGEELGLKTVSQNYYLYVKHSSTLINDIPNNYNLKLVGGRFGITD